jgi:hypothetical protein
MEEVLRFLKTYEIWIYAILGFAALLALRQLLIAWEEMRMAIFGLEKESAQRKLSGAVTLLVFILLFGAAEFIMTSVVFPDFPNVQSLATPTVELLVTPTITLGPIAFTTPTPEEGLPSLGALEEGCIDGQIEWLSPNSGETLSGTVTLEGTVSVPNLGYYTYEYSQSGSNIWVPIAAGDRAIIEQPMGGEGSGQWDTSQLVPGDYLLRLVVRDNVNNIFPACVVAVRIAAP